MIYSKRRRGGQINHYTRKSFRVKRYKHYGGGNGGQLWITDEDDETIKNLVNQLKETKSKDGRRQELTKELKTTLLSIVERAEQRKNNVKNKRESLLYNIKETKKNIVTKRYTIFDQIDISIKKILQKELMKLETELMKLEKQYKNEFDTLEIMRSNYNSALTYQKDILVEAGIWKKLNG